eukprot:scaffold95187_cov17-Tisochrysis_lutea.AAC.1
MLTFTTLRLIGSHNFFSYQCYLVADAMVQIVTRAPCGPLDDKVFPRNFGHSHAAFVKHFLRDGWVATT